MCLLEPLHPWPALRVYLLGGGNHPVRSAAAERRRGHSPTASSHQTVQVFSPAPFPRQRVTGPGVWCLDSYILHVRSEHLPGKSFLF